MNGELATRVLAAVGALSLTATAGILLGCFFAWIGTLPGRRQQTTAERLDAAKADLPLGPLERTHNLHDRLLKELATEGAENMQRESNG